VAVPEKAAVAETKETTKKEKAPKKKWCIPIHLIPHAFNEQ
jgi:hypothetical protein